MSVRTVFLGDPQIAYRAGLRSVLEAAGFTVVGEAGDAAEAIESVGRLRPALCLLAMDVGGGGVFVVKRITDGVPGVHVVIVGTSASPDELLAVLRAGASGFLPRSTSASGIVRALESVLKGQVTIPRAAVSVLVGEVRGGNRQRLTVGGRSVSLTSREAQVFELLASELSTQEIANELGVSAVTVRRHLAALAAKLGRRGRSELRTKRRAA
jgi:DNA-binding NarL/FixJ family response regulator